MERYTYFDGGKWRLKIGDTEYSGDWVDRLAAYEETGLEPEELAQAVRRAQLEALLAERGEDYLCGESGSGLSGGEKQRISIARSLLKHASVLLADEATAALDAQTAHQVTDDILSLSGVTRIVVTHTLEQAALRRYDGILVLKDGRIAESGSFDDLMAQKGYFYALYTVSQ